MARVAFSTIACPRTTIRGVLDLAARCECDGVEFRSFGQGSTRFANDPGLTSAQKIDAMARDTGVEPAGIATGVTLHDPISPPVLGLALPGPDKPVNEATHFVDIAKAINAPYIRLFPFAIPNAPLESRRSTIRRIAKRLTSITDHCRHRGVSVLIENAGDFPSYEDLAEIIERVRSPYLGACLDLYASNAVNDDLDQAIKTLGPRLGAVRLRDRTGNSPAPLGTGDLPAKELTQALAKHNFPGWIVYEWERAWIDTLEPAEDVVPPAIDLIYQWLEPANTTKNNAPAYSAA